MMLLGYSLGLVLGLGSTEAIFLAAIMSISSTAVIFKVLVDTGNINKEWVEPVIGILIIEDLAGVILLTITSPCSPVRTPTSPRPSASSWPSWPSSPSAWSWDWRSCHG